MDRRGRDRGRDVLRWELWEREEHRRVRKVSLNTESPSFVHFRPIPAECTDNEHTVEESSTENKADKEPESKFR